ncbi:MAG TPA: YhjD/YihY/BrkB family envelope integrity protein [Ktedonobacterales bacterium]
MLTALWRKFDRDWGWNLARLLAYTCIMGMFSVLGLELVLISLFLRITSDNAEARVVLAIVRLLPDRVTGAAVLSFADSIEHAPFILVVLGLPVTLWYGTRFFVVIESCLCVIFRRQQRRFRHQNLVAVSMLLLFAAALPTMMLSATFTPAVNLGLIHNGIAHSRLADEPLVAVLATLLSLILNFLILLTLYSMVTPGGVAVRHTWPGALLGAALAQSYILIFPIYTRDVLQPQHFGTVAGFVFVVLVFFYAYALFVICGAELSSWLAGYRAAPLSITDTLAHAHPAILFPVRKPVPDKAVKAGKAVTAAPAHNESGSFVLQADAPADLVAD